MEKAMEKENRVDEHGKGLGCLGKEPPGNVISSLEMSNNCGLVLIGRRKRERWLDVSHAYFMEIVF